MSNYIEEQVLASSQPLRLRGSIGKTNTIIESTNNINSRWLEDVNVDYWRQRAGWADDDETMKSYNQGVYNTYHYGNDSSSNTGGSIGTAQKTTKKFSLDHMGWILGFASTFIFLIMLVKCCSSAPTKKSKSSSSSSSKKRKGSKDKSKDKEEGRSRSRSRSRTRTSRGRSKSKSRSGKKEEASSDYKLMSDDDTKSTKSTRSRSRSRSKSGRRSRGRSKSKTRTSVSNGTDDKTSKKESVDPEQKMLV